MAVGVQKAWSTTASNNQTADSNINLTEGGGSFKAPDVNDAMRAMMAAEKAFANQITGAKDTAGSANAYTYTSDAAGAVSTSYARGMALCFKASFTNSGAATLNVDGVGAVAIKKGSSDVASGDIVSGRVYLVAYDGTYWQIVNSGLLVASYQPLDATLTAFAALTTADDSMLDFTGTDTMAVVSYATVRSNLSVPHLGSANTFTAAQTVSLNSGSPSGPSLSPVVLRVIGADSTGPYVQAESYGTAGGANYALSRARGTGASPSAVQAADGLGNFVVVGYGATAFSSARGVIGFLALENWTDSAQGTRGRLMSTPLGSTTLTERYRWGDVTSALEIGKACSAPTSRTTDWTLAATDESGATDYHTSASGHTFTIPANSSVPLPVGFVRIIDNTGNSGAPGAVTIAITTDTLRRGDGVSGTGSRTVPAGGVAAVRKVASTEWIITGTFT